MLAYILSFRSFQEFATQFDREMACSLPDEESLFCVLQIREHMEEYCTSMPGSGQFQLVELNKHSLFAACISLCSETNMVTLIPMNMQVSCQRIIPSANPGKARQPQWLDTLSEACILLEMNRRKLVG
jgi:hypothetical protein